MTWTTRKPMPAIKIHSKEDKDLMFSEKLNMFLPKGGGIESPIGDVISITTSNSINQASGTFRIELVYRTDINKKPVYYHYIRPMDIVIIYLDGTNTTMVGMIDTVDKERTLSGGRVKRSVVLNGKSLASIWEFDLVKYFENTAGIPEELLQRNLALQQGLIKLDFFNENIIFALTTLYKSLPAIDIQYKDKKLSDFIDVGSELTCRKDESLYNLNTEPYAGTVWGYFKRYVGEPFNEIWTDSKGELDRGNEKLYMRTRPTPFSLGKDGVEVVGEAGEPGLLSNWENITNWNGKTFSQDSLEHTHVNNWSLPSSDVIGEKLSRTHQRSFSIYGVLPTDKIYGNVPEYQALPPLIIEDDYKAFGSRDYIVRIGFIPTREEGGLEEGFFAIFEDYRNRLYLWNKDNHRFESGTLTIKSNPLISVGDKIKYSGKEFYTTAIQHTWRYGRPTVSVVSVDRGMSEKERIKRYKAGKRNL